MDKVIDANDVFKIIKKLRNVIPDLFEERTSGRHVTSDVIKFDIKNKKYKHVEPYKSLYHAYAVALENNKKIEVALRSVINNNKEIEVALRSVINNNKEIEVALENNKEIEVALKNNKEIEVALKNAITRQFYNDYENTFCLGDSIMKSLYSTDTELSKLESEWRTLSDLKVFKCIIYLLFYYANMYDDAYNSNRCWDWDKENWQINEIDKIIIFKSFLQSCIDYIDTQSVEIPNFTDDEFELIKQAVINKNEKCKLKDYFNTLPYIDKLCFYILDRNAVSSANQSNNGALCPFIGFKQKASLGKRFSKKLISIGQSIASFAGANKQKIINEYEVIIGDVFDTYVQNYNKIKSMTPNYEWITPETKWAPLADTKNCKNLFITKFKKSQDDMEFLCYCLLLQEYINKWKELVKGELVKVEPMQELTNYINTAINALWKTNTKINKYIKCNDYNTNLPETGKYIVDVILDNNKDILNAILEKNKSKGGGKRFTRKNKKVLQRRRVK